jgi:antitoxin PrlF
MKQREFVSVITRKGQVTIPAEIRRALGLREGDKVAFVLEGAKIHLKRAGSIIERTAGLLKSSQSLTAQELRQAGEQAIADAASSR